MNQAFYSAKKTAQGEILYPLGSTQSGWGSGYLRGMAVSGALARATESALEALGTSNDLRPARFTLDLFRPALNVETTVRTAIVRQGRRLVLIDAFFEQQGKQVARSATLFLNPTVSPPGRIWTQIQNPELPPYDLKPEAEDERIYLEEGRGWTASSGAEHGIRRHQSWHFPTRIVEGEDPTTFQMAASICDVSNVVSNWGDRGLEFINGDVTLTLARIPTELNMGLSATGRVEVDGISTGSAVLYDRQGVFGMSLVTGLANPDARVDPRTRRAFVDDAVDNVASVLRN